MSLICSSELSSASLLFAMLVELRGPQNGDVLSLVAKGEGRTALEPLLIPLRHGKYDRDRLVGQTSI